MRLLVTNGAVVTESGAQDVDVLCDDGQIVALVRRGEGASADETLDVTGKLVFPGFIDPHVHSRDPGLTVKEDFGHSTLGALTGGVTTIIEMPNAVPPVDSVAVFEERRRRHEESAWVDFALWGISIGESNLDQLGPLIEAGAAAIKIFWGYALRRDTRQLVYNIDDFPADRVILPPDNGVILKVFQAVAEAGGLLAAHCEDRHILAASEHSLGHPISTYDEFLAARPAVAEATSVAVAAELSAATGCAFHVVHMASAAGVAAVRAARARGVRITAESCPQYLTLTDDDFERIGPIMKVYPPIRTEQDRDALWGALNDGTVASIGSDHAPHTLKEKALGLATQPAGIVGCETFGPVMCDAMFRNQTTVSRLAEVLSTSTAKLFGLYPRKGTIRPGSDADLTIVDPRASRTVRNEDLVAKNPISPWHGTTLTGIPTDVVLRGRIALRNGRVEGAHAGRFVAARHAAASS
jgi:allantoinase